PSGRVSALFPEWRYVRLKTQCGKALYAWHKQTPEPVLGIILNRNQASTRRAASTAEGEAIVIDEAWSAISRVIGVDGDDLTVWQMALRALLIYVAAILLVKAGEKRFMGKNTAFDMILGIILGSVLSRAVTG